MSFCRLKKKCFTYVECGTSYKILFYFFKFISIQVIDAKINYKKFYFSGAYNLVAH